MFEQFVNKSEFVLCTLTIKMTICIQEFLNVTLVSCHVWFCNVSGCQVFHFC